MTRTGKKQPKQSPPLNDSFSAGVLPLSIAHIVRPKQVLALLAASVPGLALAGPQGGQVVAGSASINSPNANTTNIHQASNRAAIDWQSFSLGSNDYVQFFQPNSGSVALNRVVGGNPSSILGNLTANGQVFLVNPAGVYFGQGATVDVAGLVATTMNIGNDDFMAGNYLFSRDISSPDNATVINEGILAARDGGYVVLSGDYVNNNGIISAQLGTVALAAGAGMTLDIAGDNLINFTVDAASVSELAGVDNAGDLYADGGRVIMTAEVADNLVNAAVNNSGRVQAQGVLEQDGAIYLVANGGDVVNSGIVDASNPNGDGGFVRIRSTDDVTLTSTSEINASGGSGKGGFVRVIAEENLDFQAGAAIDVRGSVGEQGGFIEVSGHQGLAVKGDVHLGNKGQLLIDPATLTINGGSAGGPTSSAGNASIGESFIESILQGGSVSSGANVALVASDSITFSGGFTGGGLDGTGFNPGSGGDLFIGIGSISVGSGLGFFSNSSPDSFAGGIPPNYTADPSGSISLNGTNITVDGDLTLQAGTVSGSISSMASLSGNNVAISAAGGSIVPSFSSLNINATGNVDITATGISFSGSSADFSITAGGSVNISADIDLFGSGGDGSGAFLGVSGNGLAINGDINVVASDSNGPPPALISLQAGSGALIVNGDVSAQASFFGSGASFSSGSATITYAGASIVQNGSVSAVALGSASSGSVLPLNANISMTASNGSVTITNGVIQASASAIGSSSPGVNSVSASAGVSLSATSGDIVITNADIIATAAASNGQHASTAGSTPQATAIATVQMATSGSGAITISGGSINDGDILATADARATGNSATISGSSVISPQSTAGANINIVGGGAITTSGSVLAVANGNSAHNFGNTPSGGAIQGAQVQIQSANSSVTINNAVTAQFGLGTGDVAAQAFANLNLMTGFVTGAGTTTSYHGGGDIILNGGASLLASASGEAIGNAGIELWAVETDPMGAPPISGGGNIIINGSGLTAVGTEVANGGTSSQFADADISIEALGGTIALNAPVLSSAVGNDATGSNVFAQVNIGGGLIGAAGGPGEVTITDTVEARVTGTNATSAGITIEAGGDIQTSGAGLLVAQNVLFNPSYTSSGSSTFVGGISNAEFNVATNAQLIGIGNNLTSLVVDNSAHAGTTSVGAGASYDGLVNFNGGIGTGNVSFTTGGDLDFISDINIGSLSINANVINKSSAFGAPTNSLTINTAGDLSIAATGLFVSGSGANLVMSAAGNLQLDTPVVVSANGTAFDATIDLTAANNLTINQSVTATATGSLGAEALVNLTGGASGGAVNIDNDITATVQALGSIGSPTEDFNAQINIIGAGTSDVFLNSGTLLAQVVDGGAIAGHNNFARVDVEAIGGNLTQAAGHTAIADATGGTRDATNTTIAVVDFNADDQANVAGTVTANAAGEAFTTAVVTVRETAGAINGAVNVTGANITVATTDFGTPISGSSQIRNAVLEIRALEGDVSVDAATTLATSTITVNRAFASASIGADAGQLNLAADLNLVASGFRAVESFFVYGGTGITGGGNLSGNAIATAGSASALINISSTSGNVSLGSLSANASGTQANATVDITTTGLLTVNSNIDAVGIASTGTASAQVLLNAGSMDLGADITAQEVFLDAAGPVSNTLGGSNTITAATLGLNTVGGSAGAIFGSSANPIRVDVGEVNLGTLGQAFLDNAFAGVFQLDPAAIAGQNLTMQLAGGLNFGSSLGLTSLNVDGLDLDVGGVITADAPHVQITSTGGIAIKAAGFNLTGSISSASLTMFASSDIVIDTPITVTDNGATPNVFVDIRSLQNLTINQAILADATGSAGASVIVDLAGGSIGGAVNINADISAIARAQGTGGPSPFDPTINIVGEGSADIFLNTGTLLAKVSDAGPPSFTTPIGGAALVHVEALGGDLTQAAAHVAKAEATGGTNATNAIVELTADDQVNIAGTVIADAKGAGAATALAHIHEHTGATAGAVNVTGANITATVADFGSPGAGTRSATLEIISEQGGVSVDGATTLVNSAITTTGSAFATGNIRGTGGVVNFATSLLTQASAGSFASALVDIDAGSGIAGGGNFQADAVESGTGTALSRVHVDTAAGNATVGDLAVNASGGLATASIDVGQNIVPIPGNLTIGNISGNVTGNSNDGHLNIDLDADNGITVSGSINGVANAGANSLADAEVFIDINTGSAGANISVVGPINATATAVQSSASASVDVFGQGNVTLGNVTVTANGNNDAFSSISANAVGGNLTAGNLTVVATENSSDAIANINLDAAIGTLVAGNLSATGSGQGSGSADIDVDAQTVTVGNVTALATGATDEAFATIDVHATSGNATLATVLASATASSFGEASIDIDANNGAVVTGAVTATGIAASDASGSIDIFATGNIITGPLTITVDGGSDSADADLDVQSQGGSVTINGGLTVDVRADDYIGTVSASVRTGGAGFTGGDITINGNAQVMTLGSYASAELNLTAFSNAGAGGDIIVNGAAIAKALWQAGTSNSDNTALVDLDAQAGSLTVTGQTLAQASHQNSESANAFIVLQADTGVNVQNVSALATAPSSDASASVSILANTGAVNAGAVTVTALADTASGDAFAGFDATTLAGAITVNGAINLLASGGTGTFDDVNAIASLLTPTNLQLNGPVSINTVGGTAPSNGAIFSGFANNVTANGLISVISQTPNTEALIAFDGDGGGGPGTGTLIASTSAPNLEVADFANATVDNISSTAPLSLNLNGSLGNLSVTTSGDMNFNGQSAFASGNVLLGANGHLDASLSTLSASVVDLVAGSGDLLLNGASIIGTDGVFLSANGSVLNGPALIDGGMVGVFAGQDIDLSLSDIFVGTASDASRLPGDPLVTDFLLANDISVPSANPNALFLAGNSVQLGNIDMTGHYLWVEANDLSFTGTVTTPPNVLVQLLPSDPLASIGVTQAESFSQLVNYSNLDHFEPFTGTTIAIGASFINSDITIEEINVGSKNMLFVTNGVVEGDDLVTTTGLVALLSLNPVTDQLIDIVNTIDSVDDLVPSGGSKTTTDNASGEESEDDDEDDDEDDADTGTDGGSDGGDALIEQDENPDDSLECA